MIAAAVVDIDAAGLRQAVDAERRQEGVQDRGVVGVLDVLGIELPVVRQDLRRAADNPGRPVEDAADAADDERAEIGFEVLYLIRERPKDQTRQFRDLQPVQMVLLLAEFGGHAALPLDAPLEGDAGQMAGEIIGPAVIDAGDLAPMPLLGQA